MKRYCMVNVIKPEYVEDYSNAHMNPWPELLESIKDAGTEQELIYIYKNLAILFIECEDIDRYMKDFVGSEVSKKWMTQMYMYMGDNDWADEEGESKESINGLRKVFDLKQMLEGKFDQF